MKTSFLRLHQLSIPIFISYLVGIAFDFADNAIIGRYNLESYAAVTVIGALVYYFIGSVGTFSLSLTLNGSSLLKEKQYKTYEKLFNTTLYIGLGLSFLLMFVTYFLSENVLSYFFFKNPLVLEIATAYLEIIAFSFPLHVLIFTFSSYFKTAEKSKVLVYASSLSALVNIVVNYVLVFGVMGLPKMGANGVAIGTITGLLVSLFVYLYYFCQQRHIHLTAHFCSEQAKIILGSFIVLFIQDLFEFSVFYFFLLGVISQSGVVNTSVYSILSTLFLVMMMSAYAYGTGLIILAKKESDNPLYSLRLLKLCLMIFCGFYVLYSGVLYLLGDIAPAILTNDSTVYHDVVNMLLLFSISQLFIGMTTILRYYLNGISLDKFVLKVCCIVCSGSGLLIYLTNQFYSLSLSMILTLFAATYVLLTLIFYYKVHQHTQKTLKLSLQLE